MDPIFEFGDIDAVGEFDFFKEISKKPDDFLNEEILCDDTAFEFLSYYFSNSVDYVTLARSVQLLMAHLRAMEQDFSKFKAARYISRNPSKEPNFKNFLSVRTSKRKFWRGNLAPSTVSKEDMLDEISTRMPFIDRHHEKILKPSLNFVSLEGASIAVGDVAYSFENGQIQRSRQADSM
ncbi:hypothetical protein [Tritonibacter mobilis]|uniref:hypothetical protein n=1 Tax=Tritonibacter mobilis TaxID=379347 RepID=UPI000F7EF6A0|nr:hypothetical protein [Tritonibacter mobilis]